MKGFTKTTRRWLALTALCTAHCLAAATDPQPSPQGPSLLDKGQLEYLWTHEVLSGKHRAPDHVQRDVYRHPRETLTFFEVLPTQRVAEIWPGAEGWYTELLAPYLKHSGMLYTAHFHPASEIPYYRKAYQAFIHKIDQAPSVYGKLQITTLQPPRFTEIAPKGSLDRVLTFRNVHNWMKAGHEDTVFQAMFDALKPGGILGVVEHRAKPDTPRARMIQSGYVTEAFVITLAERTGFEFIARTQINQNKADSTDHPKGVWTLPPSLRLGDESKETYRAIGESDRMTLKFKKPLVN